MSKIDSVAEDKELNLLLRGYNLSIETMLFVMMKKVSKLKYLIIKEEVDRNSVSLF
jgi:hypothetical protein